VQLGELLHVPENAKAICIIYIGATILQPLGLAYEKTFLPAHTISSYIAVDRAANTSVIR
jgi:hypothetical protein